MSALQPPRINTTDPNQQEISDASDDHFSSASEGDRSPIPITRVERVDDSALHGEVPGTPAYNLRTQDAVPDEIEIVPEGRRSRSGTLASPNRGRSSSALSASSSTPGSRPVSAGGSPVPKLIVEKVDFKPSHGEVDGTSAKEMRMADAMPDEVRQGPPETRQRLEGRHQTQVATEAAAETEEGRQAWFRSMWEGDAQPQPDDRDDEEDEQEKGPPQEAVNDNDDDDGFGDDFDDFAEGGEDDADFGDFDEAEDEPAAAPEPPRQVPSIPPAPDILAGLPDLDLTSLTSPDAINEAIAPYLAAIIPPNRTSDSNSDPPPPTKPHPFLSDRSLSLWQQLVSPPPMQPPNWTRSRIRRLFLVSLGVPVDLDEILPPSKQKRLILPSIGLDGSPRPSTAIDRLRDENANASTTSLDSKTGRARPSKRAVVERKGPPPPPDFDANAASLLARTTEEALAGFEDEELRGHVAVLGTENERASRVLEYWLERRDEGLKEKEALEGVIENLVGFVKGRRKGA